MEPKDRLNITLPKRTNRRLKDLAEDKKVSKNTIIITAINDYLSQINHTDAPIDYLNGRLNQLTMSQMNLLTAITDIKQQLNTITETLEDLTTNGH